MCDTVILRLPSFSSSRAQDRNVIKSGAEKAGLFHYISNELCVSTGQIWVCDSGRGNDR